MDVSNKSFWKDFIELYRQNSCLWDVKSKDYTNKLKKNESYGILLRKLRDSIPDATIDTLKKKINNIRTSFRRELKKVKESKLPGNNCDTVYEPVLWYFPLLYFIAQSEEERKEKSDDDDDFFTDPLETSSINFSDVQVKEEGSLLESNLPEDEAGISGETEEDLSHTVYDTYGFHSIRPRKRKLITSRSTFFKPKRSNLIPVRPKPCELVEDDECVVTGKKLAFQLKRMDDHQRLIAEKLISDIMFYGGLGKLNEDVVIDFGPDFT